MLSGCSEPVQPTYWTFGQLLGMIGAPATYMLQLPTPIAAINLQYGLAVNRLEQVKTFEIQDCRTELRAITGPDYGRIHDAKLVEVVQRIAGNGTGNTRWKILGCLNWSTAIITRISISPRIRTPICL